MKMNLRIFYVVPALFLCYGLMASFAMMTSVRNIATDQAALLAFKVHVADPQSILANNWSISYPICSWVGISCGARHYRVVALNLSDMGLGGTIPPHLGNLSFLVYLNFRQNNFHGHLPNELRQLHRLKIMNFAYNKLNGNFPVWIGILSKLRILKFRNNSLTGHIPDSLFNLSKLEELDSRFNNIDGNIPPKIANLSMLTLLNLGDNNLRGKRTLIRNLNLYLNVGTLAGEIPTEIGNLQNLNCLVLCTNNLSGPIPTPLFNISTVSVLNLLSNQLSGQLPSEIGYSLPNLKYFELELNKLSGKIPNSITNASKLIIIDLSYNSFSGLIPNTFGNLRFLSVLNLAYNYLTTESSASGWSFLPSLTSCRMLTVLELADIPLSRIPPLIGNFSSSLQYIYAYGCRLKGSIPQEIGNLRGLIVLSFSNNDLNGTIPTTVGRLQQLQGLLLDGNNLHGSIPYDLCHLEGLSALLLHENMLSGNIPQCFGRLISLRQLDLSSNRLTSAIPSSLWNLEYILSINLSSNALSGSLPSEIQNLKVLIDLDLSRNRLSGNIPITIDALKDLVTLSLAGNQFQGPIPKSFHNLVSLESLDFSENNLTGEIPKSLEALLHLKQFNVSRNRLEGEIPTKGPFRKFSDKSFLWNRALCGPPRLQVPLCKEDNTKESKTIALPVLKYVLPLIISSMLIVIVITLYIRYRNRSAKSPPQEDLIDLATWRRTSYLDIQQATDRFNECNLLGVGCFGSVFKGTLSDGVNVAIKVFNLQLERAFRSFESECEVLRNVRHRNVVKIFSCCCNLDFKALVLEFMPNGSLEKWLYAHNYFLDMLERLNIIIDVGLALEYFHHGHSTPVVHCDLKPNNILLDENMMAHVSDFGISKLLGEGDDFVTQTMTMATIGYMAPEYGSEGIVSTRCDVYSYGILLMETFTRKKPTDGMFSEEMSLKHWVKESLPNGLTEVVDANLVRKDQAFNAKMDCLFSIMHLALDCCMDSPEQRIHMSDVVVKLQKIKQTFLDDVAATS